MIDVNHFDNYFSTNYNGFVRLVKKLQQSIRKEAVQTLQFDSKDIVNETYLKVRSKIPDSGWTGNITGYTLITLKNSVITAKEQSKKFLPLELHRVLNEADWSMIENERDQIERQVYGDNLRETSKRIFKYIETKYNDKERFIFRAYYLNKKQTYKKVQKQTGYSIGFISETIKRMKQDLRNNKDQWMK